MVKLVKRNVWKPMQIDGALLKDGMEGLIGIEECNDYDLSEIIQDEKAQSTSYQTPKILPTSKPIKKAKSNKKEKPKSVNDDGENFSPSKSGSTANDSVIDDVLEDGNIDDVTEEENRTKMQAWDIIPLPKPLLDALAFNQFYQPTDIQSLTLPAAILGQRDILGAAETGSGKTLAFGLPILAGILKLKEDLSQVDKSDLNESDTKTISDEEESDFEECDEDISQLTEEGVGCVRSINNIKIDNLPQRKPFYALILTPTRELAVQIKNHLVAAAKFTDIRIVVIVGGMASVKQERVLGKGPEIVVATPGRLWELIQQGNLHLQQLEDIRYLAIDETDRMIEKGHFQELHHILERLNFDEGKKSKRQNFVFSATLTLVHELPSHLVTKKKFRIRRRVTDMTPAQKLQRIVQVLGITDPKVVDITKGTGTPGTLTECRITCDIEEKDQYLYYFLQRHPGRTIIFCNSIGCVKRLATLLGLLNCNPLPLHASMQQRQRLKNLDRFRDKDNSILVATDVAARGLDIPCIEHVIHYQTPRTSESYVHRSGRTARASKEGITVLLVEPSELQNYLRLCRTLGKTEDIPLFPVQENFLNAVKKRVDLAREVDKVDLQVRKANSEIGWYEKAAEDMDMIIDDVSLKYDSKEAKIYKKVADVKRKQLASLLQKQIFPKGFSGNYPMSCNIEDMMIAQGGTNTESAVSVMKNMIENRSSKELRKKPSILFKPKMKKSDEEVKRKHLLTVKKGKFKKNKQQFKRKK